jgi:uncharacterized membrane protein
VKDNIKTRHLVELAVLSSFVVVLGMVVKIQTPVGIFTPMCDAGIFVIALLFGASSSLTVGALSGFLIDFLSGAYEWMFFSLVIHGLQGLIVGLSLKKKQTPKTIYRFFALVLGGMVMVTGYALSGSFLYGWTLSIVKVPGNIIQTGLGIVIAMIVESIVKKVIRKL